MLANQDQNDKMESVNWFDALWMALGNGRNRSNEYELIDHQH